MGEVVPKCGTGSLVKIIVWGEKWCVGVLLCPSAGLRGVAVEARHNRGVR
jgi:hypothetical protein